MKQILELLDRDFKIIMISMFKFSGKKVANLYEQMRDFNRDMKTIRISNGL